MEIFGSKFNRLDPSSIADSGSYSAFHKALLSIHGENCNFEKRLRKDVKTFMTLEGRLYHDILGSSGLRISFVVTENLATSQDCSRSYRLYQICQQERGPHHP